MANAIMIIPTHHAVGVTVSTIGLLHSLERQGVKTSYYKPISQVDKDYQVDEHVRLLLQQENYNINTPIKASVADEMLSNYQQDELLEKIITNYYKVAKDNQIVIIGGLLENQHQPYAAKINEAIASALNADIILVSSASNLTLDQFEHYLEYTSMPYGGTQGQKVLGVIINEAQTENELSMDTVRASKLFTDQFKIVASVPYSPELSRPRTIDAASFLNAKVLYEGNIAERRISKYTIVARTIPNAVHALTPGALVFAPSDRDDVIMATTLKASSGDLIAGLVLTGDTEPTPSIMDLCSPLIEKTKLPVFQIKMSSWEVAKTMDKFNHHISLGDTSRLERTREHFADHFDTKWLEPYINTQREIKLSPSAFKYSLVKKAQQAGKTIILPEGDETRTITAANTCALRGIAKCILLADPIVVQRQAEQLGITLHQDLVIHDPTHIREHYVARLVELRAHKGMNETIARSQLEDNVTLATMMLEAGEVDGLVSGAVSTTANTIRPPLQIIKTAPGSKIVSSIFFMCLPDQVYIYGDCAINPNPNAEQLAEIAIQSADSTKTFGIEPRVAMISYSTGDSGSGADVQKVKEATALVKKLRPDILIDGPLQYDAAVIPSIAAKKAPNSLVAGKANVFIFPDLNTGNTTYKAVQRSAKAISIGPMLQGMRKPVNDLSRGALVEDIIYTVAITAIQALQEPKS